MASNIPEGGHLLFHLTINNLLKASMISLLIGDGHTFQSFTFPLAVPRIANQSPPFSQSCKPFLVANNDSFEGLRLDMMQFFRLSCAPDLGVNWGSR